MAKSALYIQVHNAALIREQLLKLADGLVDPSGGVPGLRQAYLHVAEMAAENVRQHAPVGRPSRKDSRSHLPAGSLRQGVSAKATDKGASVVVAWRGPLLLQEFGGKSIWKNGARMSTTRQRRSSRIVAFERTSWGEMRQHLVYEKPRRKNGYFIWNVGYHLRERIGWELGQALQRVCRENGIEIQIAPSGCVHGDFKGEEFVRAA